VELTKTFCDEEFSHFKRKDLDNIFISTMTKYYKEYNNNVFIKTIDLKNTI